MVYYFKQLTAEIKFDNVNVDFIVYKEDSSALSLIMGWGATFVGFFFYCCIEN